MTSELPAMRLAEVAVARLCHDLSGAMGAVANGLELARAGDALAAEALQLAQDAAQELTDRLRLARALWSAEGDTTTTGLLTLAAGLPGRARLQLHTADLAEAPIPAPAARLILALLLLAAESLRGPGSIVLSGNPSQELLVVLEGLRAAWPPQLLALTTPSADLPPAPDRLEPRLLPAYLVALLARAAGARLSLLLPTGPGGGPVPLLLTLSRT